MMKYPGATGLVGRKDRASAGRSVVPFMRFTVQGDTSWGVFNKSDGVFNYHNGSQMWVVGMRDEQQREALKSIGKDGSVDFAWFEEANALSEDDHNLLLTRMRGTTAGWTQIMYTNNPDAPDHWINQRLIIGGQADVFPSRPEDNPYNPPEYIETLKSLTGVYYDRLWLGLWVQAEGAIYDEYDSVKHLIDWKEKPYTDRYMVSIDFGYTNPFTCSLWHIDHDDSATLYRQIYHTKRTVEEHCPDIKEMVGLCKVEAWITDHDAEDRATLERHLGIKTIPAFKSVSPGIQAFKQRLKSGRIKFMRGALWEEDQSLKRARKPTWIGEEIGGYRWSDKKQDTPIKENDHALDDARYLIAYLDKIDRKTISISPTATVESYVRERRRNN
jgi:phage terminase large subunit